MTETWSLRARLDYISLVPRPFPPPVFDHLQYSKTEGGGLEESRASCQVDVRVDLREGGSAQLLKFMLISRESTEQRAVLTLSFKC